ncbi:MAG: TRAP transporter small permease subunit [Abyssibacter sp.]|uniref:TRAP transporter small permease subunit n=1 Tax=Abyssibacter sp. TaxID=2320200 RepID=UPI002EC78B9D|nr:TRAP transporter small permease subunit [Pseudomonadota bacterium]
MTDQPRARESALDRAADLAAVLPRWIGRSAAWLAVLMAVLCFAIVALRYGWSLGWVAMQEALVAANASLFMLSLAWVLGTDGHVRVDVFYSRFAPRRQQLVNLLGTLLLLWPVCGYLLVESLDYVAAAWRVREGSREPGGLPGVYLVKTLIPVAAALLMLQGLALALRAWAAVRRPS